MKLDITLALTTEKDPNARNVLGRFNKVVPTGDPTLERYYKGGTKALMSKELGAPDWPNTIIEVLTVAQSFGRSWGLSGRVEEELTLIGNEFSIPGIDWAQLTVRRGD